MSAATGMRDDVLRFARIFAPGNRRSVGAAGAVAAVVRAEPARFDELWQCLMHEDPVVRLSDDEADAFCAYLEDRLRCDASRIVKVAALQAAFDVAADHATCAARANAMLAFATSSPWPSLRARARKLSPQRSRD